MQDRTLGTRNLNFFQAAGNFDLFKNKLILIGAFRRDFAFIKTKRSYIVGDMPAGWNGNFTDNDYRPKAPKDYFNLMFTPKNAAGVPTGAPIPADARPRVR